jgi:hypothetical protein
MDFSQPGAGRPQVRLSKLRLGADAQTAGDVATVLGKSSEQVAPIGARVINKGLLFTPGTGMRSSLSRSSTGS